MTNSAYAKSNGDGLLCSILCPWPVFIQQNDLNIGPGLEINLDAIPVIMTGGSLNVPVTAECYAGHCHSLASFSPHLSRDS